MADDFEQSTLTLLGSTETADSEFSLINTFTPGQTYYYRAVVINEAGRIDGDTETFTIYNTTYAAGANGSLDGDLDQLVFSGGSGASVTAVPDEGYDFVNWSDGSTDNPRQDLDIGANINVTANFQIRTYNVDYIAEDGGSIEGNAEQVIEHGSDAAEVEAVPNDRYRFVRWSDGSTDNPRQDLGIVDDLEIFAIFRRRGGRTIAPVIIDPRIWFEKDETTLEWVEGNDYVFNFANEGYSTYVNKYWSLDGDNWSIVERGVLNNQSFRLSLDEFTDKVWLKVEVTDLALILDEAVKVVYFYRDEIQEDEYEDNLDNEEVDELENLDNGDDTAINYLQEFIDRLPEDGLAPSPYQNVMETVNQVLPHTYIRGENYDTIYYVTHDMRRRPFLNEQVFATYADSFDEVIVVTDATLPFLRLGRPMLPKAGSVMVKLNSLPDVFATEIELDTESGEKRDVKRIIESEELASELIGRNWADYVIDIPVTAYRHYVRGLAMSVNDSINRSLLRLRSSLRILK